MAKLIYPLLEKTADGSYVGVDKYTPAEGTFTLFFTEESGNIVAKAKLPDGSIVSLSAAGSEDLGPAGKDGLTYVPEISDEGYLSFTVNGEDSGITPVKIVGDQGPSGEDGKDGEPGAQGLPGEQGPAGKTYIPSISEDGYLSFSVDGEDSGIEAVKVVGPEGPAGKDGVGTTFFPSVSASGELSWENDGDLENPAPVNIMGPAFNVNDTGTLADLSKHDSEAKNFAYLAVDTGDLYIKLSDEPGDWSSAIPFRGDRGFHYIPTVDEDGMLSWTNDGELENPEPVKVTAVRGVDYWTEKDVAEIKQFCLDAIILGESDPEYQPSSGN